MKYGKYSVGCSVIGMYIDAQAVMVVHGVNGLESWPFQVVDRWKRRLLSLLALLFEGAESLGLFSHRWDHMPFETNT